jgi:Holliday junction resolvasome RuvABC endonuclease subunit
LKGAESLKKLFFGLDLSTTNTGVVAINEEGKIVIVELVSPNKAKCLDDRVVEILKELQSLYDKYSKDFEIYASIESSALYGKGKRNELAMLNGAVYFFLKVNGVETTLVPPSRLKKYATGNGRASKDDMANSAPRSFLRYVSRHYKKFDDLIDAYFLGKFTLDQYLQQLE